MDIFKSDKALWIVVGAVVLALIIFGISSTSTGVSYKLTSEEILHEMTNDSNVVNFADITSLNSNAKTIFIDIRNARDYDFTHYRESINIPADQLTSDDNLENLERMQKENNMIVLYGSIPQEAATSWMLLKQLGINKVKMYNGTFDQLMLDSIPTATVYNEIPLADTSIFSKRKAVEVKQKEEKITPRKAVTRVQEEPSTGGGC